MSSGSPIREKLSSEQIARLREWVECTTRPLKLIGQELGVSASTISRYAKAGGWQRPEGAAPTPSRAKNKPESECQPEPAPQEKGDRRGRLTEKLWRLAERQAEDLEDQPIARAGRSLQPLARLARTLGEIDKRASPPLPAIEYEIDAPKPRRTIHELRDELAGHLARIEREEWEYDERWGRTFEDGAGI